MGNKSKRINPDTGLKAGPARVAENRADKAKARAEKTRRWARITDPNQKGEHA